MRKTTKEVTKSRMRHNTSRTKVMWMYLMWQHGSKGSEVLSNHKRGGTYSTNLNYVAICFNDTEFDGERTSLTCHRLPIICFFWKFRGKQENISPDSKWIMLHKVGLYRKMIIIGQEVRIRKDTGMGFLKILFHNSFGENEENNLHERTLY